jgi:hypothetical protein
MRALGVEEAMTFVPTGRMISDRDECEGDRMVKRLTDAELAAMRQPAKITDPVERRAGVQRATSGLRVGVRVTRSLYRPR